MLNFLVLQNRCCSAYVGKRLAGSFLTDFIGTVFRPVHLLRDPDVRRPISANGEDHEESFGGIELWEDVVEDLVALCVVLVRVRVTWPGLRKDRQRSLIGTC